MIAARRTRVLRMVLPLIATAVVYVALAVRQQRFVHQYAVNVLFWDAWDLYGPLLHGGWWASFNLQHDTVRLGLGGWAMRAAADWTGWDSRADAAVMSWTLIAAVPLGVALAWLCGARGWPLVGVPVIYLNLRQYGFLVAGAIPAQGAIPVLLVTLCGLAWFVRPTAVRLSLLAALTGVSIYTGYGFIVGQMMPPVLVVEAVVAARRGRRRHTVAAAIAVAVAAIAWAAFLHGYSVESGSREVHLLAGRRAWEYFGFVGVLLGNWVGINTWNGGPGAGTIAVGLTVAALQLWVCVDRGWRALRAGIVGDRISVALFSLAGFGVLFAAESSIGRAMYGWQSGNASRYVTLGIPGMLAVLLHLAASDRPPIRTAAVAYAGLLAVGTTFLHAGDLHAAAWLHNGCVRWADAYRKTHDQAAADQVSHFQVYPNHDIGDRLAFLERHQLNLFKPKKNPAAAAGR